MTKIDMFLNSVAGPAPPADTSPALEALWWARKGDWDRAHRRAQQHEGEPDCDLVHAYLHRQEGDKDNAGYWYRRAGRSLPAIPLQEEWNVIAAELLARG